MKKFFLFETELGGGKELMFLCLLGMIWGERTKLFYYLAILGIDKIIIGYFKLAYANPRPYMISSAI